MLCLIPSPLHSRNSNVCESQLWTVYTWNWCVGFCIAVYGVDVYLQDIVLCVTRGRHFTASLLIAQDWTNS